MVSVNHAEKTSYFSTLSAEVAGLSAVLLARSESSVLRFPPPLPLVIMYAQPINPSDCIILSLSAQ